MPIPLCRCMLDLANLSSAIYEGTSTRQITRKEVEVVVVGGRGGGRRRCIAPVHHRRSQLCRLHRQWRLHSPGGNRQLRHWSALPSVHGTSCRSLAALDSPGGTGGLVPGLCSMEWTLAQIYICFTALMKGMRLVATSYHPGTDQICWIC